MLPYLPISDGGKAGVASRQMTNTPFLDSKTLQETVDLVTFTEEILNGKLQYLCCLSYTHDSRDVKNVCYIKITEDLETMSLTRKRCKSPWKVTVLIKSFLWAILVKNLGKYFNTLRL